MTLKIDPTPTRSAKIHLLNFYIICRNDIWLTEEEQYLIQLCREYAP